MNVFKSWKILPIVFVATFAAACSSDDPNEPETEIPTEDITEANLIGAWKLDSSDPLYRILNADNTGSLIEIDDEDDITDRYEQTFVWKYQNRTLTITYRSGDEIYTVLRITTKSMTLVDLDGYKETYTHINKSEIPGESDDNNESNDDNESDDNTDNVSSNNDLTTMSADPSAYRAVLTGKYSGGKLPESLGFDISYDQDFPKEYTKRIETDCKFGGFSVEATNLVDLAKVYYRAVAIVDGEIIYGETKSFDTLQGTYKIDGKEYKFIKVTGLNTGSFSMMQTELPPTATFEMDGQEAVLNLDGGTTVTKGETREFGKSWPVLLRYPSAQEWMYAASGGKQTNGFIYSGSDIIDDVAWYSENSNGHARTPAQKKANELGFYDMSGNYSELCAAYDDDFINDWIDSERKQISGYINISAAIFQEMWNAKGGAFGGSWQSSASNCTTDSSVAPDVLDNKYDGNVYTVRWAYSRPD